MATKILNENTTVRLGRMILFKRRGRKWLLFDDVNAFPVQQTSVCTG
jgi:hypothetical protein